jgi:FtsP/CotA-like multicopper oxidase with cupredoxin domain
MLFFRQVCLLFASALWASGVLGTTQCHDETFVPDVVLVITLENTTQSCLPAKPVVLVNGTTPGPEIRLQEGQTYWIRVYNDMTDANATMVSITTLTAMQAKLTWT